MRRLPHLLLVILWSLLLAAPAHAQYGGASELVIDPPVIRAGEQVTLSGFGCGPNVEVTFVLLETGETIGATVSDDRGEFRFGPFGLDPDLPPGTYNIEAACETGPAGANGPGRRTMRVTVEVLPRAVTRSTRPLPITGAQIAGATKVGALLLTAGGLFVLAARRRRATATPDAGGA